MDLSDNMSNREMKSPRESGIGNVHFVNKNNYTPKPSKKIPYDPKKHNILTEKRNPKEIQPSIRNFNEQKSSNKNPQILLRWDNIDSTRQYPRESINLGIDRSSC